MTPQINRWMSFNNLSADKLLQKGRELIKWLKIDSASTEYLAWRHQFLFDRLRLCIWIAVPCFLSFLIYDIYLLYVAPERFNNEILEQFNDPTLGDRIRQMTIVINLIMGALLTACVMLCRAKWGYRHPSVLFLKFSWSITLIPQIIGTLFGLPDSNVLIWVLVFLAQAVLMPVRWHLHLASQAGAIVYYATVNPLLKLTSIHGKLVYHPGIFVYLFWVCLICVLGVYLYERLKRSEFESQRRLRIFLHSVSHDLRTPVMGTTMVLKSLLRQSANQILVDRSVLERLLEGSDRQLTLINSLLEARASELQTLTLNCEAIQLSALVEAVLIDVEPALCKNQIQVFNQVSADLPLIYADANQLWRLYCNLLTNALKHNPHQIRLTLDAKPVEDSQLGDHSPLVKYKTIERTNDRSSNCHAADSNWLLLCTVQDNGVGIPPEQTSHLFELYSRGARARYMPGLGLGLYLCKQIITAHGGDIGVISQPGQGTTFWFTLPIHKQ
ncbi:MAG: hypothetical protein Kow00121_24200 [Elainellaceae cyanobacterium]